MHQVRARASLVLCVSSLEAALHWCKMARLVAQLTAQHDSHTHNVEVDAKLAGEVLGDGEPGKG